MCGSNPGAIKPIKTTNCIILNPGVDEWRPGLGTNRREEIILARLRICHSYITHSNLLKGKEESQWISCNAPLTTLTCKRNAPFYLMSDFSVFMI